MQFVGRSRQLAELDDLLRQVASKRTGTMLAVRGRRQVGKSRLYSEFVSRALVPHVYFTAIKSAGTAAQLEAFRHDVLDAEPPIADAGTLFASPPTSWSDALGRLRLAARSGPLVVVLDEFPWAVAADDTLEGALQVAWDRHLQHLPVLMVLIGSDVAMMERLTEHDRPLYGRAREDVVHPLNPAECAAALGRGTSAFTAFDAYLVTGGYPKLVDECASAGTVAGYVTRGMADENSDLVVVAQRSLDAEFPPDAQARRVLSAIGAQEIGHATFSSVVGRLPERGGTGATALTRALKVLDEQKHVVAIEMPAGQPARSLLRRYRVTDPYLRFWFRFVEPHVTDIARGRGDLARHRFERDWSLWRGLAIEPEVREGLRRLAADHPVLTGVSEVGAWWNRDHSVQVDVVASTRRGVAALGSIKWRPRRRFDDHELRALAAARAVVPHAARASLVAVCPAGMRAGVECDAAFDADDLLAAWRA